MMDSLVLKQRGRIFFWSLLCILFSTNIANAWSGAIWPFNTPYMVSSQICKNSKSWAIAAAKCNNHTDRKELMDELIENKQYSIREDGPRYKSWNIIYYTEMVRYVKKVWHNPDITEDMAVSIVKYECKKRRKLIQKMLEDTDPKKQ